MAPDQPTEGPNGSHHHSNSGESSQAVTDSDAAGGIDYDDGTASSATGETNLASRRAIIRTLGAAGAIGLTSGFGSAAPTVTDTDDAQFTIRIFRDERMSSHDGWNRHIQSFVDNIPSFFEDRLHVSCRAENRFESVAVPYMDSAEDTKACHAFPEWARGRGNINGVIVPADVAGWSLGHEYGDHALSEDGGCFYVNEFIPGTSGFVRTPSAYRIPMLMHEMAHLMLSEGSYAAEHGNGDQRWGEPVRWWDPGQDLHITAMAAGYTIPDLQVGSDLIPEIDYYQVPDKDCGGDDWTFTTSLNDIRNYNAYSRCTVSSMCEYMNDHLNVNQGSTYPWSFKGPTNVGIWPP